MLIHRLELISCSAASIDVRLNSGALAEQGWSLEAGAGQIYDNLIRAGWRVKTPVMMSTQVLRAFPSTWAKRLAFGRDPRAMSMRGYIK